MHLTGQQVIQMVSSRYGVVHHFGEANVLWLHRTVEQMKGGVLKTFRVVSWGKKLAPEQIAVGVGGCVVGSQFGVPRAHRDDAVYDDDGTTFCDGIVGAHRGRR